MKLSIFFVSIIVIGFISPACQGQVGSEQQQQRYTQQRQQMVTWQIARRGIKDQRVLKAMSKVPRHEFVPMSMQAHAYQDGALPIGAGQTISQPYIVAFMTEALHLQGKEKVLEIGTGSGYQAAVLAETVAQVYSIEIVVSLARRAQATLRKLGYSNVKVKAGDGYQGWPQYAPFDAIIVTCAPDHIPQPLQRQLRIGGRMIIPVGDRYSGQHLVLLQKVAKNKLIRRKVLPVIFVPMTGEAEKK